MVALIQNRSTTELNGSSLFVAPVAAGVRIFAGALVVMNAGGFLEPGSTATGKTAVGRAEEPADNRLGADGAVTCRYRRGIFSYENHGADPASLAHVGKPCFIVDDQTVAATDAGGTRSVAGTVMDVDVAGVWVRF